MHEEIIIAGFGGQGVIVAGKLLCEAAMLDGKHVTCSVSYGPEMRGGTANSGVIISDQPIGALLVSRPTIAIVMNEPSMAKFEPKTRRGGLLIVNESMVKTRSQRKDIGTLYVPATGLASGLGNREVANVVILGALLKVKPIVTPGSMDSAIERVLSKKHPETLATNRRAVLTGADYVKQSLLT